MQRNAPREFARAVRRTVLRNVNCSYRNSAAHNREITVGRSHYSSNGRSRNSHRRDESSRETYLLESRLLPFHFRSASQTRYFSSTDSTVRDIKFRRGFFFTRRVKLGNVLIHTSRFTCNLRNGTALARLCTLCQVDVIEHFAER